MKKMIIFYILFINFAKCFHIATASNFYYPLKEIIKEYNLEHPKDKIEVSIGSTSDLIQKYLSGAPYDFLLTADALSLEYLLRKDKIKRNNILFLGEAKIYFASKKQFSCDLKYFDGKIISLPNPKVAPVGKIAVENFPFNVSNKYKIINAKSASMSASNLKLGFTDAAVISNSFINEFNSNEFNLCLIENLKENKLFQNLILLNQNKLSKAKTFLDFVKNQDIKIKTILAKYGFIL